MTQQTNAHFAGFANLLVDLDEDQGFLLEMIGLVRKEFPPLVQSLREALERGDMNLLATAAHGAKGMLLNVAFKDAAATAAEIESMAKQGRTDGFSDRVATLEQQTAGYLTEAQTFCQSNNRPSSSEFR